MDDEARTPREQLVLQEGQALRALAQCLLREDDVDDVLQSTQAAALAAGPAIDRFLRPWLRVTLRRFASGLRRGEARRRRRQREVARSDADRDSDPALMAMQAELVRDVGAAVHALEEPFRTAILLRFWRGLMPDAIAEKLGVPRNTVRSRLQRGLERLRQRLDRDHGGRERWSAPLGAAVGLRQTAALLSGGAVIMAAGMSMQTKLVAAAAAVAMAVVLVILAKEPAEPPAPGIDSGGVPKVVAAATDGPRPSAHLDRTEQATMPSSAETLAGPGVEVLVRDAMTHAAIAKALVSGHCQPDPGDAQHRVGPHAQDRRQQWSYSADLELGITAADGRVRVQARPGEYLCARAGERFGIGWFAADAKEVVIDAYTDRGTRIRAVDGNGEPVAGLPVAARCLFLWQERATARLVPLGITDSRGELACPLRSLLSAKQPMTGTAYLVPDLPGAWQRGGSIVDLRNEQAQDLLLQVPPLGSLRCALLDADRHEFSGRTIVIIGEAGQRGRGTTVHPDIEAQQWNQEVANGSIAHWPQWLPGLHHEVSFFNGACQRSVQGDGPRAAGEAAVIEALPPANAPWLVGRLHTKDHEPLAHCTIECRYQSNRASLRATLATDGDGRFCLYLPAEVTATVEWMLLFPVPMARQAPLACFCQPGQLPPGRFDLGDLQLTPAPLVLSGRIAAEGISAQVRTTVESGRSYGTGRVRWSSCGEQLLATSEPDGAFAFYGFDIVPPLRLTVACVESAPVPPIDFTPGRRNLLVALQRAGSICGQLDAPREQLQGCQLRLLDESSGTPVASLDAAATFEFPGLPRGTYTVQLMLIADPIPLAEVRSVHVEPGTRTQDPRLMPLHPTDLPHPIRVTARTAGLPVDGIVIVGGTRLWLGSSGQITIWTRRDAIDLWVCGRGLAPVHLANACTDVSVELSEPRELTVHTAAPSLPPGFELRWHYELVHPDEPVPVEQGHTGFGEWFGHDRRLPLGADGTCRVPILSEQPSRITCHVNRLDTDSAWVVPVTPAALPVAATAVDVSVRAADVQDAIQHLRDR